MQPLRRDLTHGSRTAPFVREWAFLNGNSPVDFTGASARMHVRQYEGQAGSPLISLPAVTSDILGLRFYQYRDDAVLDAIRVLIPATNLNALPGLNQPDAGASQIYRYDLLITLSGQPEEQWLFGTFTLSPGVVA